MRWSLCRCRPRPHPQGDHHSALPRARQLVESLPERDQISQSYEQLIAMLALSMGGRVAEELVFGKDKVTSGRARRHPAGDQDRPRHGHPARLLRTSSARS